MLSAARIALNGWIDSLYAGPTHRFTYPGFGWVPQPGHAAVVALVAVVAASSVALILGWRTRLATLGFLVAFAALEPLDEVGRASCRERVVQYVSSQVVAVLFNKKHI